MYNCISLKPALGELDGELRLTPNQRNDASDGFELNESVFKCKMKHWGDLKKVVKSCFKHTEESWYLLYDDFHQELIFALNFVAIKTSREEERTFEEHEDDDIPDSPLVDYCRRLIEYYSDNTISARLKSYYKKKAIEHQIRYNKKIALIEAEVTAWTLVGNASKAIREGILKKNVVTVILLFFIMMSLLTFC